MSSKQLSERIKAAEAAEPEVRAWRAKVALVDSLPNLRAKQKRLQAEAQRRERVAEAASVAKEVLARAAEDTQAWRARFLELCGQHQKANRAHAGELWAQIEQHVDALGALQAPILEAWAELRRLAGADFERLWEEAGGYDDRLSFDFSRGEVGYSYRESLKRRLRGRTVYRPAPVPPIAADPLGR